MKILLVRPDGIGDQILCLPVATALRRTLPRAHIAFLSSRYAAPVLDGHPDVDAVVGITGQESLRELVSIFRDGYEAAVFLKPFRRLMWAAWLARVPARVATGYRWYSILANRRVYEHRHDFSRHEADYNVALLRGLGLQPQPVAPPALVLTDLEREQGQAVLADLPRPRVVLHPGGFATRRWHSRQYHSLAEQLMARAYGVIFTGTAEEAERFQMEGGMTEVGQGIRDLRGQLTIRGLMSVIAASQAVVSGSTGPAHIAAALGVRTVSLFDPRRSSAPTRWRPLGSGAVLTPQVPTCERCIYEACPYWDCLDRISPETVVRELAEALQQPTTMRVVPV